MNVNINSIFFTKLLHLTHINSTYFEPTTTTVSLTYTHMYKRGFFVFIEDV